MSRTEYDAMAATGRLQPTLKGTDMKHVTLPSDRNAFRSTVSGSLFAEFDMVDAQTMPGGNSAWLIVYGPRSIHGKLALKKGLSVAELPYVKNLRIIEVK